MITKRKKKYRVEVQPSELPKIKFDNQFTSVCEASKFGAQKMAEIYLRVIGYSIYDEDDTIVKHAWSRWMAAYRGR